MAIHRPLQGGKIANPGDGLYAIFPEKTNTINRVSVVESNLDPDMTLTGILRLRFGDEEIEIDLAANQRSAKTNNAPMVYCEAVGLDPNAMFDIMVV